MEVTLTVDNGSSRIHTIPDGQLFYARRVGTGRAGVYIKLDGSAWPIGRNGIRAAEGSQYSSPNCPVDGYDPITFDF